MLMVVVFITIRLGMNTGNMIQLQAMYIMFQQLAIPQIKL